MKRLIYIMLLFMLGLFGNVHSNFEGLLIPNYLIDARNAYNENDYHSAVTILNNNYKRLSNKEKYLLAVSHKKLKNVNESIELFEELVQNTKILRLSSALHLAETYFYNQDYDKSAKYYEIVLNNNTEPYFIKKAYYNIAKINRIKGNPTLAVEYLNKLLPYYSTVYSYVRDVLLNELTYPDILYEIGNVYLESNDTSQALEYYLRLIRDYSRAVASNDAVQKIESIENARLTDADKYQIAMIYYNTRNWSKSEEKFRALLNSYLRRKIDDKKMLSKIRYYLGMTYYRQNENEKALRQFDIITKYYTVLDECPPTLFFAAIIKRRLGDDEGYLDNLNRIIINYPNNRFSYVAFTEILQYYAGKNNFQRMQNILKRMIRYYANQPERLIDAYWLKITYYYSFDYLDELKEVCHSMEKIVVSQSDKLKLNFWLGNVYEKLKDYEQSKKYHLKNLLIDNRENYYFWSSIRKIDSSNKNIKRMYNSQEISDDELFEGIDALIRDDYPKTVELIRVLAVIGLYDEIFNLINNQQLSNVGKQNKYLAKLSFQSKNYYHSILYARYYKNNSGLKDSEFDLWNLLYPAGYIDKIKNVIQEYPFDINYVLAIIYQESRFTEKAVSIAGARGLMQIMPATGRKISNRIGFAGYNPDLLFDVNINIRFGINELQTLYNNYYDKYDTFTAQVFTAIGYNAGPHRVEQWLNRFFTDRDVIDNIDYFVEVIPFNETRNYVRCIIRGYWLFKEIYGE